MSKRQDIIDVLINLLQSITIANGYNTDCGQQVHPWRITQLRSEEVPCIIVFDTIAVQSSESVIGLNTYVLDVHLVAFFPLDTPIATGRDALADIIKVIGTNPMLNGLIDEIIRIENHEVGFELRTESVGMARVKLQIPYSSNLYEI